MSKYFTNGRFIEENYLKSNPAVIAAESKLRAAQRELELAQGKARASGFIDILTDWNSGYPLGLVCDCESSAAIRRFGKRVEIAAYGNYICFKDRNLEVHKDHLFLSEKGVLVFQHDYGTIVLMIRNWDRFMSDTVI